MGVLLYIFCVIFGILSPENVYGQTCNDCISYTDCKEAVNLAINKKDTETKALFKLAACDFEYKHGYRLPKVCCSLFGKVQTDDPIETHRNVALLPESCGDINGNRIVGGTVAAIYEFPWMALIAYETSNGLDYRCAGSIINSRYILTAAHCINRWIHHVRIGEYDLEYTTDCQGTHPHFFCESHLQDVPVEDKIVYKQEEGQLNDIALLRLQEPIDFSHRNAEAICLPVSRSLRAISLPGTKAVVAGWGATEGSRNPSVLRKVSFPIHNKMTCYQNNIYGPNGEEIKREFCAGANEKDSCTGDSGGPLMIEKEYRGVIRQVQYGIVSSGPRECGSKEGGLYTDVSKYMQWILDHIKE